MARVLRRLLLTLVGLCLLSCLSPTLPLPPPDRPDVSAPDENGLVRLQGFAAARAEVVAYDHNSGIIAGQVTTANARYDFTIAAEVDDTIELWYMKGNDESSSVVFQVPSATP
jgi:hypothetical protein